MIAIATGSRRPQGDCGTAHSGFLLRLHFYFYYPVHNYPGEREWGATNADVANPILSCEPGPVYLVRKFCHHAQELHVSLCA